MGGRIGYFQGDPRKLVDDIGELRPTIFIGALLVRVLGFAGPKPCNLAESSGSVTLASCGPPSSSVRCWPAFQAINPLSPEHPGA